MRDSEDISIKQAIIHLVDPKKNKITLSNGDLPLAGNKDTREYLEEHIHNSLRDSSTRSACFERPIANPVMLPICSGLFRGRPFVDGSQKIANHLMKASDKRISAGAIVVCKYTASNYPDVKRFIAILKLDPADGFQPTEVVDKKGNIFIRLEKVENVVPSTGERLLKCAFIQERDVVDGEDPYDDYDMMVLDRQKAESHEPARFFTEDFLQALMFGDAAELTRKFYTTSISVVEDVRSDIGEQKSEAIRKAIDTAVAGVEVNIADWTNNLNVKKSVKQTMLSKLQKVIPDPAFPTDEKMAGRLTKKRVFKGDYNFKLQLDAKRYDEVVVSREQKDAHEQITLRIPNFREVEK